MRNEPMTSIETKEIRGLNIKIMITIVGAVISSTIAIMMTINGLRTDLVKLQSMQDNNKEIFELKLRTLDVRLTTLELEVRNTAKKVQDNSDKLSGN